MEETREEEGKERRKQRRGVGGGALVLEMKGGRGGGRDGRLGRVVEEEDEIRGEESD